MTTERRTTIIEVDASQALAAEARLEAATAERVQAVRELARVQTQQERDRIAALRESESAVKRLAAVERQQRLEARELVSAARTEEKSAQKQLAAAVRAETQAQREASTELRRRADLQRVAASDLEHHAKVMAAYGADESAVLRAQVNALDSRVAAERIIGNETKARLLDQQRELALIRQQAAASRERGASDLEKRSQAFGKASDAAREQSWTAPVDATEQTNKWADAVKGVRRSYLDVASSIGNVLTGVQSLIGLAQQAVAVVDGLADESSRARTVGANLQVSIEGARSAFKGYVDDVEIARIANQAYELGVVSTGEELTELAAGVQAKAEKLGVSSTQLFENAVTAIGRGSALILDNLGIVLDQARAEEIYAEALGVTIDQLTAYQKEMAFAEAAKIEIARAGEDAASAIDGMAESWKRGRVSWENFRTSVLGFDDTLGQTRDALRKLDEDDLAKLQHRLDDMDWHGQSVVEVEKQLREWGLTLAEVEAAAAEAGTSFADLIKKASSDIVVRTTERARKEMEATHRELAGMLETRADEVDQAAKITGILDTQGKQQLDILRMQEEALELRLEAAEAIKDENAALEITRALEENRARQEVATQRKRGGRGGDPNAALKRGLELTLATLNAQRQILEATGELQRDELDRLAIQQELVNLAGRELDARQAAAEAMKVHGAQQRLEQEIELMEIATERRLLGLSVELEARAQERAAVEQRIAQIEREIEVQERLGASTELLQRHLLQAQITLAEQYGTAEDQAAQVHAIALERADEIAAARVANEQAALDAYQQDIERKQAAGWQEQDLFARRIELEIELAQAAGNTERVRQLYHEQEIHRIKREVEVRQRALAATGQALTAGMQLFSLVAEQSIKDEKKRERAMMRARGIEALARGAIETVESVASFASFNYVQGALHAAAAGVAYATGAALLAGKPPGGRGAGAGGGGGAGAEHRTVLPDDGAGTGRSRDAAAVPPSAEELLRLRQQQTGTAETTASKGTVININGPIVAGDAGSLIHDMNQGEIRKWGTTG